MFAVLFLTYFSWSWQEMPKCTTNLFHVHFFCFVHGSLFLGFVLFSFVFYLQKKEEITTVPCHVDFFSFSLFFDLCRQRGSMFCFILFSVLFFSFCSFLYCDGEHTSPAFWFLINDDCRS